MAINWKLLNLRGDLIISVTSGKRFTRWKYNYYKKGKRSKKHDVLKLNRRVKKHIKKNYFRKLIFKL